MAGTQGGYCRILAVVGGLGSAIGILWGVKAVLNQRWDLLKERKKVTILTDLLAHEKKKRDDDRKGRTTAEKRLRELAKVKTTDTAPNTAGFQPIVIAHVLSGYPDRRGTPRQGAAVPAGRGRIVLEKAMQAHDSLDGLTSFSHLWIVWLFHENTNVAKLHAQKRNKNGAKLRVKARVKPPRLDGKSLGLFATRTPHRPNPIGLTCVRLEGVKGREIIVSGLDMLNGTPVLDIKPYLPIYDSVPTAQMPDWISAGPTFSSVIVSPKARQSIQESASALKHYESPEAYLKALVQILSHDIRSHFQRNIKSKKPSDNSVSQSKGKKSRKFEVRVDAFRVLYEVIGPMDVLVTSVDLL
ncbi:hypothetical protein AAMO2058_001754100 [Amorphochlora amoebiformis]